MTAGQARALREIFATFWRGIRPREQTRAVNVAVAPGSAPAPAAAINGSGATSVPDRDTQREEDQS